MLYLFIIIDIQKFFLLFKQIVYNNSWDISAVYECLDCNVAEHFLDMIVCTQTWSLKDEMVYLLYFLFTYFPYSVRHYGSMTCAED